MQNGPLRKLQGQLLLGGPHGDFRLAPSVLCSVGGEGRGAPPHDVCPPLWASASPQLQRFKRSLSLKTILRSKSVENFFLRSNSELKFPSEVLLSPPTPLPPPSPPPLPAAATPPRAECSPSACHRPLAPLKPMRTHSFQEYVFKKHCSCELCHQQIVGECCGTQEGGRGTSLQTGVGHGESSYYFPPPTSLLGLRQPSSPNPQPLQSCTPGFCLSQLGQTLPPPTHTPAPNLLVCPAQPRALSHLPTQWRLLLSPEGP